MRCGLLGEKLGHSFSKEIHEKLGRYSYELFEVPRSGLDAFLMKIMRKVLLSGSTPDAKTQADKIRERIDSGVDMVSRDNIASLVKDARKKMDQ